MPSRGKVSPILEESVPDCAGPLRRACDLAADKVEPNKGWLRTLTAPGPSRLTVIVPNLPRLISPDMPADDARQKAADEVRRLCDAAKKGRNK